MLSAFTFLLFFATLLELVVNGDGFKAAIFDTACGGGALSLPEASFSNDGMGGFGLKALGEKPVVCSP